MDKLLYQVWKVSSSLVDKENNIWEIIDLELTDKKFIAPDDTDIEIMACAPKILHSIKEVYLLDPVEEEKMINNNIIIVKNFLIRQESNHKPVLKFIRIK
jgi:hypothetical protein